MDFGGTPPPLHGRSATVTQEKIHPQGLEMVVLQILGIPILQVYPGILDTWVTRYLTI